MFEKVWTNEFAFGLWKNDYSLGYLFWLWMYLHNFFRRALTLIWYGHAASMENKISCDSTKSDSPVQQLSSDATIEVLTVAWSPLLLFIRNFDLLIRLFMISFFYISGEYWGTVCFSTNSNTIHWISWHPGPGTDIEDHASAVYGTGMKLNGHLWISGISTFWEKMWPTVF